MNGRVDDFALAELAAEVGRRLLRARRRLATAESCTGGWIGKCLTDIPGSSGWFERGFVTYSDAAKTSMLGVQQATLDMHGAVSEATAREMAEGALSHSEAQVSVAVTGIAGPTGGTKDKPVGLVWIAWAFPGLEIGAKSFLFDGDRDKIRRSSVFEALAGLRDRIDG